MTAYRRTTTEYVEGSLITEPNMNAIAEGIAKMPKVYSASVTYVSGILLPHIYVDSKAGSIDFKIGEIVSLDGDYPQLAYPKRETTLWVEDKPL